MLRLYSSISRSRMVEASLPARGRLLAFAHEKGPEAEDRPNQDTHDGSEHEPFRVKALRHAHQAQPFPPHDQGKAEKDEQGKHQGPAKEDGGHLLHCFVGRVRVVDEPNDIAEQPRRAQGGDNAKQVALHDPEKAFGTSARPISKSTGSLGASGWK